VAIHTIKSRHTKMKSATFNFFPVYCPRCGLQLIRLFGEDATAITDFFSGKEPITCTCGLKLGIDREACSNEMKLDLAERLTKTTPDIFETGYFATYGKPPTLVHVTNNRKPLCGARTDPKNFQWCAAGIIERYVNCKSCQRLMFKFNSNKVSLE
jgi:hypothetical protein